MSITYTLERLFESPAKAEERARDARQDLETGKKRREGAPPGWRCRVCDLEADDGSYCPRCLADTMVRREDRQR